MINRFRFSVKAKGIAEIEFFSFQKPTNEEKEIKNSEIAFLRMKWRQYQPLSTSLFLSLLYTTLTPLCSAFKFLVFSERQHSSFSSFAPFFLSLSLILSSLSRRLLAMFLCRSASILAPLSPSHVLYSPFSLSSLTFLIFDHWFRASSSAEHFKKEAPRAKHSKNSKMPNTIQSTPIQKGERNDQNRSPP